MPSQHCFFFVFVCNSCMNKKKNGVSHCAWSAVHICQYIPLEFCQGFHLKCKSPPCPPDKRRTDTAAADIVLQKIVFFLSRQTKEESRHPYEHAIKTVMMDLIHNKYI
ncbi:hypothetical protein ILYODFUR_031570 [Ilyodon furcidens]|uniref:Uncharacterized protein n=1 Tax=Ilyodon furcidens TaxID=33524 RepID=A0ABV0VIS3_9TELE